MLNKDRLINDLKNLHKEIVKVYRQILVYKFENYTEFQKKILNEYKKSLIVTDEEKVNWNEQYLHRSAYTLLNKILFIRICEDKGFMLNEEDKIMGEEISPNIGQKLSMIGLQKWSNLITNYSLSELIKFAFKDMNKSYRNIPLYREDIYDWLLPNNKEIEIRFFNPKDYEDSPYKLYEDILIEVIKTLDTSRYNFGETKDNVLGDVYERFMDRETRKKLGQFYTPDFVISYILERTVQTIDVISNPFPKVLDPACGSGHFLTMAYDLLRDKFKENLLMLQTKYKSDVYIINSGIQTISLPGEEYWTEKYLHYHILKNCLFGADVDGFALQITTINLLLKDLDNFITDELNIIECDSLIKWEQDYEWKELEEQLITGDLFLELKKHVKKGKDEVLYPSFEEANEYIRKGKFWDNKFDFIIGNPPYIRHEKIKNKKYLQKNYEVYNTIADILTYFIERAQKLLKKNAFLGFIVSDKFTRTNYGKKLRKYLLDNMVLKVYKNEFESKKVSFEDALVESCIIIFENVESKIDDKFLFNDTEWLNYNDLSEIGWYLANTISLQIKKKMDKVGKKIKGLDLKINYGIKTGFNDAFIIDRFKKDLLLEKDSKNAEIIKPLLRGKDIKQYSIENNDYYLINTDYSINIEEEYPSLYQHFLKFKQELASRADQGANWYNLRACTYYDDFEKPKVLFANMSVQNRFYYDEENYYANQKTFMINSKTFNLKYLTGILNSSALFYYFRLISPILPGDTREYSKVFVEEVPVVINSNYEEELTRLVEEIIIADERYRYHTIDLNHFKNWIREKNDKIIRKENCKFIVDYLVYKIYDLTSEEIKVIEKDINKYFTKEKQYLLENLSDEKVYCKDFNNKFEDFFLEEISSDISPDLFYQEHIVNSKSLEEIAKEYNYELITTAKLRNKYDKEYGSTLKFFYNLNEFYEFIENILITSILKEFQIQKRYFSNLQLVKYLEGNMQTFKDNIQILRKDDVTKKSEIILKEVSNKFSENLKGFVQKREKNKPLQPLLKYDTNIWGLSEWSDEIHKAFFVDAIDYFTSTSNEKFEGTAFEGITKTKKKALAAIEALKELEFNDKEDYIELLTEKVRKAFE